MLALCSSGLARLLAHWVHSGQQTLESLTSTILYASFCDKEVTDSGSMQHWLHAFQKLQSYWLSGRSQTSRHLAALSAPSNLRLSVRGKSQTRAKSAKMLPQPEPRTCWIAIRQIKPVAYKQIPMWTHDVHIPCNPAVTKPNTGLMLSRTCEMAGP